MVILGNLEVHNCLAVAPVRPGPHAALVLGAAGVRMVGAEREPGFGEVFEARRLDEYFREGVGRGRTGESKDRLARGNEDEKRLTTRMESTPCRVC